MTAEFIWCGNNLNVSNKHCRIAAAPEELRQTNNNKAAVVNTKNAKSNKQSRILHTKTIAIYKNNNNKRKQTINLFDAWTGYAAAAAPPPCKQLTALNVAVATAADRNAQLEAGSWPINSSAHSKTKNAKQLT